MSDCKCYFIHSLNTEKVVCYIRTSTNAMRCLHKLDINSEYHNTSFKRSQKVDKTFY